LPPLLARDGGRESVPSRAEVLQDQTIGGEKPLGLSWRLEAWPPALALAGGLRGVLRAIVQIPMLAMRHARQAFALGRSIALQLLRDHHARDLLQAREPLAEAFLGRGLIATPLRHDIQPVPVLSHRPPEGMRLALDREDDLVQVPFITRSGTPAMPLMGGELAEFAAPRTNGSVREGHPAGEQEFFHTAIAEATPEIEPDRVADDLDREAVVLIGVAG
jgi:hypothetical protein